MKYITDLHEGERVVSTYMCKQKNSATTKNGKPYENVIFQDKTGSIDAKIWDPNSMGIEEFGAMDYVEIQGEVTSFNGALQISVVGARRLSEGEYDIRGFRPTSERGIM